MQITRHHPFDAEEALARKLGDQQYVEGKLDDYLDPAKSVDELLARIP